MGRMNKLNRMSNLSEPKGTSVSISQIQNYSKGRGLLIRRRYARP